jgi:hypothetical protein
MAKRRHAKTTLPPLGSLADMPPPVIRIVNRTAFKAEWADPDDFKPNARRTARQVSGYMAFCPLRWCLRRHGPRSSYTLRHIVAADKLRLAFDGSRLGFMSLKDWRPVTAINYRPSTGPTQNAMRQLKCRRTFDQVWSIFPESDRALLLAVVLRNIPVGRTADLLGWTKPKTTQAMVAVLDKLADHFGVEEDRAAA